jgi:hypothetical protein
MKKNSIILIITLLLVVFAALLYFNNRKSTLRDREKAFAVRDTSSVTKIFLADKKNRTILLEREEAGRWMLNETYLARQSGVELLLETMKNLAPRYPVPKSAHDNIVAQMAAQSVKVEVYQQVYRVDLFDRIKWFPHEKRTKTYYVGSATADNMGTFMLMEGAEMPFVVHLLGFRGYVAPRYSTLEKEWRDHTIFKTKLYDLREVSMEIPREPENSYKIINGDDQIQLLPLSSNQAIPFDTLKLLNFMTAFADIRFEELLDQFEPERRDSITQSLPKNIISVTDVNGVTTTIKTFFKENTSGSFDPEGNLYSADIDRLYALVNDERDFVLIQYYVFDKIMRPLSYFRPEE